MHILSHIKTPYNIHFANIFQSAENIANFPKFSDSELNCDPCDDPRKTINPNSLILHSRFFNLLISSTMDFFDKSDNKSYKYIASILRTLFPIQNINQQTFDVFVFDLEAALSTLSFEDIYLIGILSSLFGIVSSIESIETFTWKHILKESFWVSGFMEC